MKRILITGLSGTGKTTVLEYMKGDQRLSGLTIGDVDDYLPEWFFEGMKKDKNFGKMNRNKAESEAIQFIIKNDIEIIGGLVMISENMQILKDNGFDIIELVLSSKERSKRVNNRAKIDVNRKHEYGTVSNDETIDFGEIEHYKVNSLIDVKNIVDKILSFYDV